MTPRLARTASLLTTPPPAVGVEIAPRRVAAVVVSLAGGRPVVSGHDVEPLPEGAVVPSLNATNIPDPQVVVGALTRVFDRLGARPKRVGLVVPDSVAKVSLVRFDKVPERPQELEELVRWQVRKAAPFRVEDAQIAFTPGARTAEGGREFVVAQARRAAIEEYERVCAGLGAHAGLVDLASFNLINVALLAFGRPNARPAEPGDWLLVHVTPEYSTIAIVRSADVIFFRNRPAEADEHLADLVHQTAMYYEDRLGGGGFSRVVLAGGAAIAGRSGRDPELVRRDLEERLGSMVEPIDPRGAASLTDRIAASADLLHAIAAPLGIVLREMTA